MAKQRHGKKPSKQLDIAKRRIAFLFAIAAKEFADDKNSANAHVKMARRIAMKHKIKFSASQKKSFCKECLSFLKPGANCRVRVNKGRVIYYCSECKSFMRHPVK